MKPWAKAIKKGVTTPVQSDHDCPYRACQADGIDDFKTAKKCYRAVSKQIKKDDPERKARKEAKKAKKEAKNAKKENKKKNKN